MLSHLVLAAALVPAALGFKDTHPVVAWSSHSSSALDSLASTFTGLSSLDAVFDHLFQDSSICDHDAVVLVDQPGLHASDLRMLAPSSQLTLSLSDAKSAVQLPYARRSSAHDLTATAERLAARCGSSLTSYTPSHAAPASVDAAGAKGGKHVMCMTMPEVQGAAAERKDAMAQHDSLLSTEFGRLSALFPNHLILLTGSGSGLSARDAESPASLISGFAVASFPVHAGLQVHTTLKNNTHATNGTYDNHRGGILADYQLLTPGLILSLLISFFVLVPALYAGINALSSIQAPLIMAPPKDFSASAKKNN